LTQNDEDGKKAEEALVEASHKLKGKILLSLSKFDEGLGSKLAEFVGLARSDLPAVRILVPGQGGAPKKYKISGAITPDNIVKFYEDFDSDSIQPYKKSEPVPE